MNERFTTAIGALIIAAAFFVGGVFFEKHTTGHDRNARNVNPIGFHVDGQAYIKKGNLDASQCGDTKTCWIRFDFSTDHVSLQSLDCPANSNCLSFKTPPTPPPIFFNVAGGPNPDEPSQDKVDGRLMISTTGPIPSPAP
ncbi:MAG TPA: hypothetical protein VN909_07060 [Candidatus Dormibacteraeota bacterium]|nr:hypothetical protein [Candidatus Dormibacteraeota bacterium]